MKTYKKLPVNATIAVGKNHNILLMIMMMTSAATATAASTAATNTQTTRKVAQETAQNVSKRLQIGSGCGHLFDDAGFLVDLDRITLLNTFSMGKAKSQFRRNFFFFQF